MPVWPFRRRRAQTLQDGSSIPPASRQQAGILTPDPTDNAGAPSEPNPFDDPTATRSIKIPSGRKASFPFATLPVDPLSAPPRRATEAAIPRSRQNSHEDVTALPNPQSLSTSPHLRSASLSRPQIPYNFHRKLSSNSGSQQTSEPASRAVSPVSKRSSRPYASLGRKASDRSKRSYAGGAIREEDLREMNAPLSIPRQRGANPLQGDAQKLRTKDSSVTLPAEGSLRSSMTGWIEQRGWEVSNFAIINPRPSVRSAGPMGFAPSSLPAEPPSGVLYRIDSIRAEGGKQPVRDLSKKKKKYQAVGNEADELDASDLRVIMERDAKRREQRHKNMADKLDRKLRAQASQQQELNEGPVRRQDSNFTAEEVRSRIEEERNARTMTPPTDVHPALRSQASSPYFGPSGSPSRGPVSPISAFAPDLPAVPPQDLGISVDRATPAEDQPNPFVDPENEDAFTLAPEHALEVPRGPSVAPSTARTSYEEAEIGTVQTLRMSLTATPPLSPVRSRIAAPTETIPRQTLAGAIETTRPPSTLRHSSITTDTLRDSTYTAESPVSPVSPTKEKRSGPWAAFFRRGTTIRKPSVVSKDLSSEASFSNTSRESMRAQSIPAHLVDLPLPPAPRPPAARAQSGPPVRTQSRFREDLPELPISPPASRTATPDVLLAAAARRIARSPDLAAGSSANGRKSSLADIMHAERESDTQSYNQRQAEFGSSFEELGGVDIDADYLRRNSHRVSSLLASSSATPHQEISRPVSPLSDDGTGAPSSSAANEPITTFGSVRRKATLVAGDARVRSREGLLSEYISSGGNGSSHANSPQQQQQPSSSYVIHPHDSAAYDSAAISPVTSTTATTTENGSPHPGSSPDDDNESEFTPSEVIDAELRHAKSVSYAPQGHSRQFSAGSARLLDVRRSTADPDKTGESPVSSSSAGMANSGSRPSTGATATERNSRV